MIKYKIKRYIHIIYLIKKWYYIKQIKYYKKQQIINNANAKIDRILQKAYGEILAYEVVNQSRKTGDF